MKKLLWIAAIWCLSGGTAHATITPASLFTDNAVLQREQPIPVWGSAEPNEQISVSLNGKTAKTTADTEGNWILQLPAQPAGGPYSLALTGSKSAAVTLNNIAVGEVWLCSGQSNMEYPMTGMNPAAPTKADIPNANDPLLRFAIVARTLALTPQKSVGARWQETSPATVSPLSAVAYFFARDLRRSLNVPVGIVEAAYGGTYGQSWMSREALSSQPILTHYLDEEVAYATTTYPQLLQDYQAKLPDYQKKYDADKAAYDAAKLVGTPLPRRPGMPQPPQEPDKWQAAPNRLFNGMIAPLIPYGIRGALWYQGEANWNMGYEYKTLLPTLIGDWRGRWKQGDFPFYVVQLPPYNNVNPQPERSWFAEVREAQRLTSLAVPNTAMVVTTDVGDQKDIHPFRKEPVGHRLALIARNKVYGEKIESSGPTYDGITVEGSQIRVKFTHADGLHSAQITDHTDDGPVLTPADQITGFTIAGADGNFFNATAKIEGTSVVVSAPEVPAPTMVRYGWSQFPLSNLQNSAGLWASPFETGEARWISKPRTPVAATTPAVVPVATLRPVAPALQTVALSIPAAPVAPTLPATPVVPGTAIILKDADFENTPSNWTIQERAPMSQIIAEAAHSGKMGLRVIDNDEKFGSSAWSAAIAAEPSQGVRLTFWAKTATDGASGVSLAFFDANRKPISEYSPATVIGANENWKKYRLMARAPLGTASMKIWVHSFSSPKITVDVDDFYIETVSGPEIADLPVPIPATAPPEAKIRQNPPYIILKIDDLARAGTGVPVRWKKLGEFIKERKLHTSLGIICNSLEGDNPDYINWLKELQATGLVEFWCHGYTHRQWDENGKTLWEFKGPSYEEQKQHFARSEELAREKLGVPLAAFGPGYGATDENTVKALQDTPEIKIWLYAEPQDFAGKINLSRIGEVNIENPLFSPSLDKFIEGYNRYPDRDYFVIQGHANMWDDARFDQFVKIIDFLTEQKAVFVTPSEYVQIKKLSAPMMTAKPEQN